MLGLVHSTALTARYERARFTCATNQRMHLVLRMFAPKQEHHTAAIRIHGIDDSIRKRVPAQPLEQFFRRALHEVKLKELHLVRRRLVRPHGEASVEEEHALARPLLQAAVTGAGENNGRVVQQLLVPDQMLQ